MELKKAYEIFNNIEKEIDKMTDRYGNLPDEFEFDFSDDDERYKHNKALEVAYHLDRIRRILDSVNEPIMAEGYLHKNSNERYELNGIELTTGSPIIAWKEGAGWIDTHIAHGEDYYIYHAEEQDIEKTLIRIR